MGGCVVGTEDAEHVAPAGVGVCKVQTAMLLQVYVCMARDLAGYMLYVKTVLLQEQSIVVNSAHPRRPIELWVSDHKWTRQYTGRYDGV